jgi:hypothetical protein
MIKEKIPAILVKIDNLFEAQGLYNDFTYKVVDNAGVKNIRTGRRTGQTYITHTFKAVITGSGTSLVRNGEKFDSKGHSSLLELSVLPFKMGFTPVVGQSYNDGNYDWFILEIDSAPQNGLYDILLGKV